MKATITRPLPPWCRDNAAAVREEAAEYRDLTPGQRGALLEMVCQAGVDLLAAHADPERALQHRDPLPPSTIAALARLRRAARRT